MGYFPTFGISLPTTGRALVLGVAGTLLAATLFPGQASAKPSERRKIIASEQTTKPSNSSDGQVKRIKYKKENKVDFDDALIEGGIKSPFSSMTGTRDGDNKTGFVKVRKEWHDQMIMSVNGLSH